MLQVRENVTSIDSISDVSWNGFICISSCHCCVSACYHSYYYLYVLFEISEGTVVHSIDTPGKLNLGIIIIIIQI